MLGPSATTKPISPNIEINSSLIKKLCNRNFGIGGDGLILIKESKSTDFEIFHYTSDGNTWKGIG